MLVDASLVVSSCMVVVSAAVAISAAVVTCWVEVDGKTVVASVISVLSSCDLVVSTAAVLSCCWVVVDGRAVVGVGAPVVVVTTGHTGFASKESKIEKNELVRFVMPHIMVCVCISEPHYLLPSHGNK